MSRRRVFVALVCGSRNWRDPAAIRAAIQELVNLEPFLLVVTGAAPGVDTIANDTAHELGAHTASVSAVWKNGKGAGPARNRVMLDLNPHYVIAFRSDGPSPGTDDCTSEAIRRGFQTTIFHEDGRIVRHDGVHTKSILEELDDA